MKQKDLLILLLSSSLLVFAWIIFSFLHKSITSTIPQTLNIEIIPVNPEFDPLTIEKLKKRKNVLPNYNIKIQSNSVTIVPTITASDSGNLTNEATSGGTLNQ